MTEHDQISSPPLTEHYAQEIGEVWTRIMQRLFGEHQVIRCSEYNPQYLPGVYQYGSVPEVIGQHVGPESELVPDTKAILKQSVKFCRMREFLGNPTLEKDGLEIELDCPTSEVRYDASDTEKRHGQAFEVRNVWLYATANQENLNRLQALEQHLIAREELVAADKARRGAALTEAHGR